MSGEGRMLTRQQAKVFYDRLGAKQDWQAFYEVPVINNLIAHAALEQAQSVFEFGFSKFFLASEGSAALWFVVRMNVGAQWMLAGWEKITSPAWGTSGKAMTGFATGALA